MSKPTLVYVYKIHINIALNRVFSLIALLLILGITKSIFILFCFCFVVLLISDQFNSLHFNNLKRVARKYIINKFYYHMTTLLNVKYLWLASEEQSNPL